jgi:hypothetical protein
VREEREGGEGGRRGREGGEGGRERGRREREGEVKERKREEREGRERRGRGRGRGEYLSAQCDALDKLVRDGLVNVVGIARVLARSLLQQRVASVSVVSVSVLLY